MSSLPALWMRGGTSKGLFLNAADLPPAGPVRDALLARALGSPDPYQRQTDGVGGATSSTSKVVVLQPSTRAGHAVDYWFGQVDVATGRVDATGSCGNLAAAVGPAAVWLGVVKPTGVQADIKIWQANLGHSIHARFALRDGWPVERGSFREDGVPFPAAEVALEFFEPDQGGAMLPTGNVVDELQVPGLFRIKASLVNAGNPTVLVRAADLGLAATEGADRIHNDRGLLDLLEAVRCAGAVAMGLARSPEEATRTLQAVPKIAWVAPALDMHLASGETVRAQDIDLCARILSMGRLHHAFTGTGAIALAVAAQLPGSVVHSVLGHPPAMLRIGHASGRLEMLARVAQRDGRWVMERTGFSRSARRLMQGQVFVG